MVGKVIGDDFCLFLHEGHSPPPSLADLSPDTLKHTVPFDGILLFMLRDIVIVTACCSASLLSATAVATACLVLVAVLGILMSRRVAGFLTCLDRWSRQFPSLLDATCFKKRL